MNTKLSNIGFFGFDVFGTVVDWRSGIARASEPFLKAVGLQLDPFAFADEWRSLYQPSMERVRSGERSYVTLDVLNFENLETVLTRHDVDLETVGEDRLRDLNSAWEKLDPWPDSLKGLALLKVLAPIGPLSNGHIAGMLRLARFAGLPWDVIVGSELTQSFKPQPRTYLRSAEAVGLPANRVAMVAAHNDDLVAARDNGLTTIFVRRPYEHGPDQTTDLRAEQQWDVVVDTLVEAAEALKHLTK